MSIASCEAPDERSYEREVSRESLATEDEIFEPTSPEVDGTVFGSRLRCSSTAPAGTGESEAALAAPTVTGRDGPACSVRVAQALAGGCVGASDPRVAGLSCGVGGAEVTASTTGAGATNGSLRASWTCGGGRCGAAPRRAASA